MNNFNIEKLTGRENFNTWSFAVQNLLLHEDLWDAIEIPVGENGAPVAVDSKKDAKAKAKIVLTIDSTLLIFKMKYKQQQHGTNSRQFFKTMD